MQITIPPELEQFIQRQLAAGKYQSALDVIAAGVYLLEQQEDIYQGRLPELQQDVQIGLEAVRRGEVLEGPTAMAQIREKLRNRHASPES